MKEKLSLLFNNYELDELSSIQYSYLFARGRISAVPSFNDILKATLLYTYVRTRDGRVLKGFTNNFLKRRRLAPRMEDTKDIEESRYSKYLKMGESAEMPVTKPTSKYQKPSSYSFFLDDDEMKQVRKLRDRVAESSGIDTDSITNTELVRECVHFVVDRQIANIGFRYITYIGFLYGLRPVVSVILGEIHRDKYDFEELAELLASVVDRETVNTLNEMHKDVKTLDEFIENFKKFPNMSNNEHLKSMVDKFFSQTAKFDFYLAFVGAEMVVFTGRFKLKDISDAVLYMLVNEKNAKFTKVGIGMFENFLRYLYAFSEGYEMGFTEDE